VTLISSSVVVAGDEASEDGAEVSTLKLRDAVELLPAGSLARTSKVWELSLSAAGV
jgi:hypothetical protein